MSYYWRCLEKATQAVADFTITHNYREVFVKLAILLNHKLSYFVTGKSISCESSHRLKKPTWNFLRTSQTEKGDLFLKFEKCLKKLSVGIIL